ncbi:MAG: energy-coupling factor ABC transporter substrate-binding protein [Methanobacteriaceae archaeon]|jgi:cobalt/nickel transport protein|nr:energy-coupling factor ABC transporter substrate-binding protein [Candidatus Methanorudis spinitermitis]
MNNTTKNIILLILVVVIAVVPMVMYSGLGEDEGYFSGTDDVASRIVEESGYEPHPILLWEPPSPEIESLLFAVQAAIGGVILGYFIGKWQGQANLKNKEED